MERKLVVGIEILVILLSVVFGVLWFMFPHDNYESMFALSGFILVIFESLRRFMRKSVPNSKDIQLFEQFSELLSNNDYIRFYKEHDFLASFERQYWSPLMEIVEIWDNAAHQFVDPQLEQARKSLYKTADDLGMAIARNTVPNRYGRMSVVPDRDDSKPYPSWIKEEAKEINNLSPAFVEEHEKFIRLGRKLLY